LLFAVRAFQQMLIQTEPDKIGIRHDLVSREQATLTLCSRRMSVGTLNGWSLYAGAHTC
jgi:hypothetical protein